MNRPLPDRPDPHRVAAALSACLALILFTLGLPACAPFGSEKDPDAYSLVAHFELAEVERSGGRIDFGKASAHSHMVRGWSFDKSSGEGGWDYVWSHGESSVLRLLVSDVEALQIVRFRAFPWGRLGAQEIEIFANETRIGSRELRGGSVELEVALPAAALRLGINELEFRYAKVDSPRNLVPGSRDKRPLAVAWEWLELGSGTVAAAPEIHPRRDVLELPRGSRVEYLVRLHAGARLRFDGLKSRSAGLGASGLHVALREQGGEVVRSEEIQARGGRVEIPLEPPVDGGLYRLSLMAVGSPAEAGARVVLDSPRVVGAGFASSSAANRPNLVIYLVDALRADHLGVYGYPRPTTPRIDEFASDAVVFDQAIAQSPWTRAAVASVFTGLSPSTLDIFEHTDGLSPASSTLAEWLRAAGYRTTGFVTNVNADAAFEFHQGFDDFVSLPLATSEEVNASILPWLREVDGEAPFFLWVHTLDPHTPYDPPEEFRRRFAASVPPGPIGKVAWMKKLHFGKIPATAELVADLRSLYDAEVAFNDRSFGALVDELRRLGLYENTSILFLSDHGEAFAEHDAFEHSEVLYRETLRIPMIWKPAGESAAGGRVVEQMVQQVDILPTVLDLVGGEIPNHLLGRSLEPLLRGQELELPPRPAISYSPHRPDGRHGASVLHDSWKLIQRMKGDRAVGAELYDRSVDPAEQDDLEDENRQRLQELRQIYADHEEATRRLDVSQSKELDPEVVEKLRALGYID